MIQCSSPQVQLHDRQRDSADEWCIAKKIRERDPDQMSPAGPLHRNGGSEHCRDTI